jgi:hypothetical protein
MELQAAGHWFRQVRFSLAVYAIFRRPAVRLKIR